MFASIFIDGFFSVCFAVVINYCNNQLKCKVSIPFRVSFFLVIDFYRVNLSLLKLSIVNMSTDLKNKNEINRIKFKYQMSTV